MRLAREKKLQLARTIADAALMALRASGTLKHMKAGDYSVNRGKVGPFDMNYATPFNRLPGLSGYLLDIYYRGGKVFSFEWPLNYIRRFQYGPWMNLLVPGSYVPSETRQRTSAVKRKKMKCEIDAHSSAGPGKVIWITDKIAKHHPEQD